MFWLLVLETLGDAGISHYGIKSGVVHEANPLVPSLRAMWLILVPIRFAFAAVLNLYAPEAMPMIAVIWAIPLVWNPLRIWQMTHRLQLQ